jgi:hypothetical protein
MEYFTADTVKQAAASPDSFANYLNKVSGIKKHAIEFLLSHIQFAPFGSINPLN